MQRVDDMGWFLPCWKPRLDMKDGELEKALRNLLQHHCRYKSFHEFLERDASAGEGQSLMDSPACSCWWHPQINGPCAAIISGWGTTTQCVILSTSSSCYVYDRVQSSPNCFIHSQNRYANPYTYCSMIYHKEVCNTRRKLFGSIPIHPNGSSSIRA